MTLENANFPLIAAMLVAVIVAAFYASAVSAASTSGITSYTFDPNPKDIMPKLYNWQINLSGADSRETQYEIVQIMSPGTKAPGAVSTTTVLVDSSMISPAEDGTISFKLHIGDKQPTQNMGRRGDVGEPIIFSGIGTAKAQSGWIVLPGGRILQMSPAPGGERLVRGTLDLIRFAGSNERGEQYRADVVLRRK